MKKSSAFSVILVSIVLLCSNNLYSQAHQLDSLKNDLKNHPQNDTTRINLMYKVALASFQVDVAQSKKYLNRTKELSDSLDYILGKAKVSYLSGILANREGRMEESFNFFKLSEKYYDSIDNKLGLAAVSTAFGITHYMNSEYDQAIKKYQNSLDIYKEIDEEEESLSTMVNIANVHLDIGQYDEALEIYHETLKKHLENEDEINASGTLHSIGHIHKVRGDYPEAIKYFNRSIDLSKKYTDTFGLAIRYNSLGDTYNALKKFEKALYYHKESFRFAETIGDKRSMANNLNNIGNINVKKGELSKALNQFQQALEICKETNDVGQEATCYHNIGGVYLKRNEISKAKENLLKSLEISQQIGYQRLVAANWIDLGSVAVKENEYRKAVALILSGKEIAVELELLEYQKNAAESLSEAYNGLGQHKKALEAYQEYKIFSDSIFNQENLDEIAQIEYEYKYKQQLDSANIRELKLSKEVLLTNEDLEASRQRNLWAVITILGLILVAGGIIVFLRLRNLNAKTQNIQMEQKLLRSQMTPHFIFNSLSVLQGMILNREEKKSVSYLSKFSKLLRLTLENSRDKEVLLKDELDAVRNYLALQNLENTSYNFDVVLDENIQEDRFKIPPMLIQPFIENSIEHAFSNQQEDKRISVELSFENNQLICQILDNGVGIDSSNREKNPSKNSLSTTISAERLEILSKHYKMNGSISIEDRSKYNEQGTVVTLVIPYKSIDV